MIDYANEPVSISSLKAQRSGNSKDWTARDALIDLLREIDSGKIKDIDSLFIIYRVANPDGTWESGYRNSTPDLHTAIGMIENLKYRMLGE